MYFPRRMSILSIVVAFALPSPIAGQQDDAFRNPRAAERMAITRAAVDSIDRQSRAIRKVLADSALGTATWFAFSPDQLAAEGRAGAIDQVLQQFLTRQGMAFGMDDPGIELREIRRDRDAGMVHLRLRQYWRQLPVRAGELRLHLRQTGSGYVVETANGRVYPDIDAPETPAFGPEAAVAYASGVLSGDPAARVDSAAGGPLYILPFAQGYRLVYTVLGSRLEATIDARSGEVLDTLSRITFAARHGELGRPRHAGELFGEGMSVRTPPSSPSGAGYEPGSGTDALERPVTFTVYNNDTDFELRSNELGFRISEIIVRDFGGARLDTIACLEIDPVTHQPVFPVARNGTEAWPNEAAQRQQVSAMVNMVSTGNMYYDSLNRRSYDNALPGAAVNMCVNGDLGNTFNAGSYPDNSLGFVRDNLPAFLGSAAAKDVVTHEFAHNVARLENIAQNTGTHEVRAMNEALSDYFGARHRGSACLAQDAYFGCLRDLSIDRSYAQGSGMSAHDFGVVFSGALWQVASISPPLGKDVDNATHNAIRFYMLQDARMLDSREAVVRAAQDRQHANQNFATIVPHLEDAFADRGVGYPAVALSGEVSVYECGSAFTLTVGNTTRRYQVAFESGTGMNNDQSVANVNYFVELEPFAFRNGTQTFDYSPLALDGHRADDDHVHAFRVRFNDGYAGVAGILLDYYIGWLPGGWCYVLPEGARAAPIAEAAGDGAPPPPTLTVRQVVGRAAGPSLHASGAAGSRNIAPGGLAAEVAGSGVMTIDYGVPVTAQGNAVVQVYDMRGRLVRTITTASAGPGWSRVTWDGHDDRGTAVGPGVYLAVVRVGADAVRTRLIIPRR